MKNTLLSSPLQGFTDYRFRNAFHKYFGGIDTFYSPYIRLNGKLEIKSSYERDVLPKNNTVEELIPQVMTNDADEFIYVAKYVQALGYKELNWNLGCPYPMVTNRSLGAGLISDANRIDKILHKIHQESDIIVSMKMRMGYNNSLEILDVFPLLEKYPLKNIAIHARIGKQLYKGGVDLDSFQTCLENTSHKIYYNGDIDSVATFHAMKSRFPNIDHWMIGRWLISDPFLPGMIKNDTFEYPSNKMEIFSKFHDTIFHEYGKALSGSAHLILKMIHFWEYFALSFTNPAPIFKKIKKSKSIRIYQETVKTIIENEY